MVAARRRLLTAFDRADSRDVEEVLAGIGPQPPRHAPWTTVDVERATIAIVGLVALGLGEGAEALIRDARSRCRRAGLDALVFEHQLANLRWFQGAFDELDELAAANERRYLETGRSLVARE